jgi:hypothetical protein
MEKPRTEKRNYNSVTLLLGDDLIILSRYGYQLQVEK